MIRNDAIIIAHHHPTGILRSDTIELLERVSLTFKKVLLISTFLKKDQLSFIPNNVEILIRENYGYDFFSYRIGILALLGNGYDHIYVTNTSFVCVDIFQFESSVLNASVDSSVFGISQSNQIADHMQSYFFAFPAVVYNRHDFISWWLHLVPLNIREEVILTYELGFSKFLKSKNIGMTSIQHANEYGADPTHITWKEIYEKTGIIKNSLIKNNPYNVDISHLYTLSSNPKIANLLNQALAN